MSINPDEDTEFNDALRKHGIIPPRELSPPSPSPSPSPTFDDLLNGSTTSELRGMSEDATDDETEMIIAAYRRQRIAKGRQAEKKARFGRVYPIGREDYTREVTEASKVDEDDDEEKAGTGVVCFLYKDGIPRSQRAFEHVRLLAERYPRTKFVSIVGDKCIPNLPDTRVPMLIVYKKGDIRHQVVAWGADKERRLEELEVMLVSTGAVHPQRRRSESDEDEDGPSSRMHSIGTFKNGKRHRSIRGGTGDDSDSDFDFDL